MQLYFVCRWSKVLEGDFYKTVMKEKSVNSIYALYIFRFENIASYVPFFQTNVWIIAVSRMILCASWVNKSETYELFQFHQDTVYSVRLSPES